MSEGAIFKHEGILMAEDCMADLFQGNGLIAPLDCHTQFEPVGRLAGSDGYFRFMRGVPEFLQSLEAVDTQSFLLDFPQHSDKPSTLHHIIERKVIVLIVALG